MRSENLFDQRCARARHPDDENGSLIPIGRARNLCEALAGEISDQLVKRSLMSLWLVWGLAQVVADAGVGKRFVVAR